LKRVSLELGGKSPNIVFVDADQKAATAGGFRGIFFNKGQGWCAGLRFFVEQKIYDEFFDGLAASCAALKKGTGPQPESRIGPLVSEEQFQRVLGYVEIGKSEGARIKIGGERNGALGKGYFVKPTVFMDVNNTMRIAQEEIFGPVVCAIPFKNEDDVIR